MLLFKLCFDFQWQFPALHVELRVLYTQQAMPRKMPSFNRNGVMPKVCCVTVAAITLILFKMHANEKNLYYPYFKHFCFLSTCFRARTVAVTQH